MEKGLFAGKTKSEWMSAFSDAGPAIQLRLRRDVFGDISKEEQNRLVQAMLTDPRVMQILNHQDEAGWFYDNFHGYDSMESSIRFLIEMGFPINSPFFQKAAAALLTASDEKLLQGIGRVGYLLEQKGFSGSNTIRAWLLALLGQEDRTVVQLKIADALKTIQFAATVNSIESITYPRGRYVLVKDQCYWPDLYHFRLLASTSKWRTVENLYLLGDCVENMCRLQPIPHLHACAENRPIAPGAFGLQILTPAFDGISNAEWMAWFQRICLFAQLGVLATSETMAKYYHQFQQWVSQWNGWFELPLKHFYYSKWGAYTGLMLEQDWRKKERRRFDLSFRCLLIESQKRRAALINKGIF